MPSKIQRYGAGSTWVEVSDLDALTTPAEVTSLIDTRQGSAYVGPRRDGTTTVASFSNNSLTGRIGLHVPTNGDVALSALTGQKIFFSGTNASGSTESWWGDISNNRFQLADMVFGVHPVHTSWWAWWLNSAAGANDYIMMRSGGTTLLNASAGASVELRVANETYVYVQGGNTTGANVAINGWRIGRGSSVHGNWPVMYLDGWSPYDSYTLLQYGATTMLNAPPGGRVDLNIGNSNSFSCDGNKRVRSGQFTADHNFASIDPANWITWSYAAFVADNNGGYPRVAFHSPNVAPQLWCRAWFEGEGLGVVNSLGTQHAQMFANEFYNVDPGGSYTPQMVGRSATAKGSDSVRSLRAERDTMVSVRSVATQDPDADVVAVPDIMGLRPVVYRPPVGTQRVVQQTNGTTTVEEEGDTWQGRAGRRERMGLLAAEVAEIIPSAVAHASDGEPIAISYTQVTVALLDHVQQLTIAIETLEARITELERTP